MSVKLLLLLLLLLPVTALATPPTPVLAPVAHPLAPNPHTSVGLFWWFADPATGRQAAIYTYKVKRCSGVSCTPTTVIASGLTTADYQDTGLASNTTFGYRYLANDGVDGADSPTVYVTTLAADSNLVQFPSTVWSNLLGPLPEAAQIPFAWYNSSATTTAQTMISKFPVAGVGIVLGTGAINTSSTTLTGTGTFFLEQVSANNPTCLNHISINGVDAGTISSVNSNTSITLTTAWTGGNVSGATLNTNVSLCSINDPLGDYLTGNQLGYYDSPLAMWQLYYRTGDPQYLRGAIKYSDAVFSGYLWQGRNRGWNTFTTTTNVDNMPAPRNFQFSGYLLMGLAGHQGVWDLLDDYLTNRYPTWVSNYRGGSNDFQFMRERAYTVLFAIQFLEAAPDSFKRSNGTTTSLNGGTTVDGSLATGRKGHWKTELDTDIPGFITDDQVAAGEWYETNAGAARADDDEPYPPGAIQPWLLGLLGDALGVAWRCPDLSTTTHNAARKMVLKLAAYMATRGYNSNQAVDDSVRMRNAWYFSGGGTRLNPYAFEYGSDAAILNNTPDADMLAQYRQGLPLMLATMGWAKEMSGDPQYTTWGDEFANAAFAEIGENTGGTGDGKKALCANTANFKDYGQCYRTSSRYMGQRLGSYSSLGTPPTVTMPSNVTLTGSVNQTSLTASVSCSNSPCTYKWYLVEYPMVLGRQGPYPTFSADSSLTTTVSGLESGIYKLGFYTLDNLGMVGFGTVNVTVGDGVYPPVVVMHKIGGAYWCDAATSISGIEVRAYSPAGRSLSHSFSIQKPKDASAPTVTPSGTTGNFITVSITGLTTGWYLLKDVVTDSAGATRTAYFSIAEVATDCQHATQPSTAHNTIPLVAKGVDHVLPAGATATRLYVMPIDPEGVNAYSSIATGYFANPDGAIVVGPLTHSWAQTAGPVTATITNGTTIRPDITGLTQAGTYTFQYTGTDQQGDTTTASINVTVQTSAGIVHCKWGRSPRCQ